MTSQALPGRGIGKWTSGEVRLLPKFAENVNMANLKVMISRYSGRLGRSIASGSVHAALSPLGSPFRDELLHEIQFLGKRGEGGNRFGLLFFQNQIFAVSHATYWLQLRV
jgi:hypothetical protein